MQQNVHDPVAAKQKVSHSLGDWLTFLLWINMLTQVCDRLRKGRLTTFHLSPFSRKEDEDSQENGWVETNILEF